MKRFLLLLFLHCSFCDANAQPTLWEPLPLYFDYNVTNMYYDSIGNSSYVMGDFQHVNGISCNIVEITDTGYRLLPPTPTELAIRLVRYNDLIFVSGNDKLASWNGNNWTLESDGQEYRLGGLFPYQDKLLLTGSHFDGSTYKKSIFVWDNGIVSDNFNNIESLFGDDDLNIRRIVEYKGNMYIAGNFSNLDTDPSVKEIAMYNGSNWQSVGELITGGLSSVHDMLVWKDTLYVCGAFDKGSGSKANGVAQWDGSQWHEIGTGLFQGSSTTATDLMILHDELYVVGAFNNVNGMQQEQIGTGFAKWTGTEWCTMGTKADNALIQLGRFKDDLYIMGGFNILNGDTIGKIARWIGGDYTDSCSAPLNTVGIDNLDEATNALNIYPNPATENISIRFSNGHSAGASPATIRVLDVSGRILISEEIKVKNGINQFEISTAKLVPGLYHINIATQFGKFTSKFSKR